jgi:hypothetical protein
MYAATSWGYRHRYLTAGVRIAAGLWLSVLGVIQVAHGYQWGWGLFGLSALIFWAAYLFFQGKLGAGRHGQR